MFGDRGETYKCELISELEDGHITTYTQGAFTDLCRGPHLMTTALSSYQADFRCRCLLAGTGRPQDDDTYLRYHFPEEENAG